MPSRYRFWSTTSEWMLVESCGDRGDDSNHTSSLEPQILGCRTAFNTHESEFMKAQYLLQLADLQRQVADLLIVLLFQQLLRLFTIVHVVAAHLHHHTTQYINYQHLRGFRAPQQVSRTQQAERARERATERTHRRPSEERVARVRRAAVVHSVVHERRALVLVLKSSCLLGSDAGLVASCFFVLNCYFELKKCPKIDTTYFYPINTIHDIYNQPITKCQIAESNNVRHIISLIANIMWCTLTSRNI